jgi:ryanodine receptor 2
MPYVPKPFDTQAVTLDAATLTLVERLAACIHDAWAAGRLKEGWTYGPSRDDDQREHPCLIPYEDLEENEKEIDRITVRETLKILMALGYRLQPPPEG